MCIDVDQGICPNGGVKSMRTGLGKVREVLSDK
jgi:hypothetical protein